MSSCRSPTRIERPSRETHPAPFGERDLSADAVDYIVGAAEQRLSG